MFWMRSPSQRIFGEASEKNLYLSQLIILDTLEKCLAGVSSVLQTPPVPPPKKTADQASTLNPVLVFSNSQSTGNVFTHHQSGSCSLGVPLEIQQAPRLHLQALGGRTTSKQSQLPLCICILTFEFQLEYVL